MTNPGLDLTSSPDCDKLFADPGDDPRLPAPQRHCGRCQGAFDGDPSLHFQSEWALCPACTSILLPKQRS